MPRPVSPHRPSAWAFERKAEEELWKEASLQAWASMPLSLMKTGNARPRWPLGRYMPMSHKRIQPSDPPQRARLLPSKKKTTDRDGSETVLAMKSDAPGRRKSEKTVRKSPRGAEKTGLTSAAGDDVGNPAPVRSAVPPNNDVTAPIPINVTGSGH